MYISLPFLLEMASSTTMIVWVQIEGKSKKKVTISSNADYALMATLLYTHGHPSLHSWSPFSALMVTVFCTYGYLCSHGHSLHGHLCTHGHTLHSWSPLHSVTLVCTHGHLCTQSPFSALMVPFSALMVTLFCTSIFTIYGENDSEYYLSNNLS